jgi:hypothetical protein
MRKKSRNQKLVLQKEQQSWLISKQIDQKRIQKLPTSGMKERGYLLSDSIDINKIIRIYYEHCIIFDKLDRINESVKWYKLLKVTQEKKEKAQTPCIYYTYTHKPLCLGPSSFTNELYQTSREEITQTLAESRVGGNYIMITD